MGPGPGRVGSASQYSRSLLRLCDRGPRRGEGRGQSAGFADVIDSRVYIIHVCSLRYELAASCSLIWLVVFGRALADKRPAAANRCATTPVQSLDPSDVYPSSLA